MTKWLKLTGCPLRISMLAPIGLMALTPAAIAQEQVELTAPLQNIIDALSGGDRGGAISRIDRIESIDGLPRLVTNADDFVDRVLSCELASISDRSFGENYKMIATQWTCEDGNYEVMLMNELGSPFVTVANFVDPERAQQLRANPPRPSIPPPAPPAPNAENDARIQAEHAAIGAQICDALGTSMVEGDIAAMEPWVDDLSRFMFGFHNPFYSTVILEQDGNGMMAGQAMLDVAREAVGEPHSYSCEFENSASMLRWNYSEAGRTGFAFILFFGSTIRTIDMRYATVDKLIEAQSQFLEETAEAEAQANAGGKN